MDILGGTRTTPTARLLRAGLCTASLPYAAAMRLRRFAYRRRLLPSHWAPVPVLCVGNLTTGGTGKTPMVAWCVQRLQEMNRHPAILTRGYRARDGASDEADLLARLASVPVIVNPDRVAGARDAAASGADVLVMDDGLQHLRLRRDLDIVLIDATNPFGFGHTLPRGLLREPLSALRCAGAIVITRSDAIGPDALRRLDERLGALAPGAVRARAVHAPVGWRDDAGNLLPPDALRGRRVCAFCGLGNPDAFFATVERLAGENVDGLGGGDTERLGRESVERFAGGVVERIALPDHAHYDAPALAAIASRADAAHADALVTTEKDDVKLPPAPFDRPLYRLVIRMEIVAGEADLLQQIARAANPPRPSEARGAR